MKIYFESKADKEIEKATRTRRGVGIRESLTFSGSGIEHELATYFDDCGIGYDNAFDYCVAIDSDNYYGNERNWAIFGIDDESMARGFILIGIDDKYRNLVYEMVDDNGLEIVDEKGEFFLIRQN